MFQLRDPLRLESQRPMLWAHDSLEANLQKQVCEVLGFHLILDL